MYTVEEMMFDQKCSYYTVNKQTYDFQGAPLLDVSLSTLFEGPCMRKIGLSIGQDIFRIITRDYKNTVHLNGLT